MGFELGDNRYDIVGNAITQDFGQPEAYVCASGAGALDIGPDDYHLKLLCLRLVSRRADLRWSAAIEPPFPAQKRLR